MTSIVPGDVWRGTLALNNMAVHLMEKGQPSYAMQLIKDVLRINSSGGVSAAVAPSCSPSTSSSCNPPQNKFLCLLVENMIRNATLFGSSIPSNLTTEQEHFLPFQVRAVEYDEIHSILSAVDPSASSSSSSSSSSCSSSQQACPQERLILHPVYIRDIHMESPSPLYFHSNNNLDDTRAQQKLCGILYNNLGIASFLQHRMALAVAAALTPHTPHPSSRVVLPQPLGMLLTPLISTTTTTPSPPSSSLSTTTVLWNLLPPLVQVEQFLLHSVAPAWWDPLYPHHFLCQAKLSLEMAHLLFASLLQHSSSLSDDVCLTLISVLSLTCLSRIDCGFKKRTTTSTTVLP